MATQIQIRRDLAANWSSSNPILAQGEYGIESDDLTLSSIPTKVGDGVTAWNDIPYQSSSSGVNSVTGEGVSGTPENVILSFPNQSEIQTIRPLKTVNSQTLEGSGNIIINGELIDIVTGQNTDFSPFNDGGKLFVIDSSIDVNVTIDTEACSSGETIYFRPTGVGQIVLVVGTATIPLDPFQSLTSRGTYATIGVLNVDGVYEVIGKSE